MSKKIKIKNWMTSQEGILDHLRSANPFTVRIEIVDHFTWSGLTEDITSADYGTDGIDISFRMQIGCNAAYGKLLDINLNDPDLKANLTVVESDGTQLFYDTFPVSVISVHNMDDEIYLTVTLSVTEIAFVILWGKYNEKAQERIAKYKGGIKNMSKKIKIKKWMTSQERFIKYLMHNEHYTISIRLPDDTVICRSDVFVYFENDSTQAIFNIPTDDTDADLREEIQHMIATQPNAKITLTIYTKKGNTLLDGYYTVSTLSIQDDMECKTYIEVTLSIADIIFGVLDRRVALESRRSHGTFANRT